MNDFDLSDLFKAYFDCRKNKRCKKCALKFEINLEQNLLELYKELKSGRYKIGRCICFVVTQPKPREVWAANFRDRIVHHLIYNFISERFYKRFIKDTYSCIPERGTFAAAKRLEHFTRSATQNFTQKKFYLKADLSNFFVSIDKDILFKLVKKYVSEEWILKLVEQIIYNDPTRNVYVKSSRKKFELIPAYKSLFNADKKHGLPIGNLTSQFFSNVYLDVLDQYVKRTLKCQYYVRYVDDFVIIGDSAKELNEKFNAIREFLEKELKIELHPRKKLINRVEHGIDFVGFIIKPNRIFMRKRTRNKMFESVKKWHNSPYWYHEKQLIDFRKTINSYIGMMVHLNEFNFRKKLANDINNLFIRMDDKYSKVVIT